MTNPFKTARLLFLVKSGYQCKSSPVNVGLIASSYGYPVIQLLIGSSSYVRHACILETILLYMKILVWVSIFLFFNFKFVIYFKFVSCAAQYFCFVLLAKAFPICAQIQNLLCNFAETLIENIIATNFMNCCDNKANLTKWLVEE